MRLPINLHYMFCCSTMVLATLLEPLVELSREATDDGMMIRAMLLDLDKYLRWTRFIFSLF